MNLTWLLTFRKVAETRSYTRASDLLFVSQPAVSQQIRHLERYFGAKLIRQFGRELQLTEAGEQVYALACNVEGEISLTRRRLDEMAAGSRGLITIVSFASPLLHYIPHVLKLFWEEHPDVTVKTVAKTGSDINEAVKRGTADLGMQTSIYLEDSLVSRPCRQETIIAVASPESPLARKTAIPAEEFAQRRISTLPTDRETRQLVDRWFANHDVHLQNLMEVATVEEIRTASLENLAVGFVNLDVVREDLESGRLVQLDIDDFNLDRTVYLIHRRDVSGPAAWLADILVGANALVASA